MGGLDGQRQASAALLTGKRSGTNCTGGCSGPRAGLDRCAKSRPPPGFDPLTAQPVVSRYTDYDIPAHYTAILHLRNGGK